MRKGLEMVRGVVASVVEGAIKLFSGTGRTGESFAKREFFQHYGYTSIPKPGAETVLFMQGNQIIVVASDDRRYRIPIVEGEVALYTDEGDFIHLKRGNEIRVQSGGKVSVKAATLIDLDGGSGSTKGVVQGDCLCPFTGQPHMNVSGNVRGSY